MTVPIFRVIDAAISSPEPTHHDRRWHARLSKDGLRVVWQTEAPAGLVGGLLSGVDHAGVRKGQIRTRADCGAPTDRRRAPGRHPPPANSPIDRPSCR